MPEPAQIGKYEIVNRIGRGGMGVVYKARDTVLGRMVAIKVMNTGIADSADGRARFLREARAVSMLQHPNIVVVHELGELEDNPYIVMEFLDGEPLDRAIRDQASISLLQKIDIILQVTKALQYAHQKGIIHRDIKPGNIILMRDGSVKVVDFGIAHLTDETITQSGMLLGTVSVMSPEQLNGEPADVRTDIFSLGVVFYLLLTGRAPFEGASTAETVTKILFEQPARLELSSSLNRLQPILDRALAKKKAERYQTCTEMYDALSRVCRRYDAQAQLAALEDERKALLAQLGKPSGVAPAIAPQPAPAPVPQQPSSPPSPTPAAIPENDSPPTLVVPPPVIQPKPLRAPLPAASSRMKLLVAGLALLCIAAFLVGLYLFRSRHSHTPAAATVSPAPTPTPPVSADIVAPPSSSSTTPAADTATTSSPTSPSQPPIEKPLATAGSESVPTRDKPAKPPVPPVAAARKNPSSPHPASTTEVAAAPASEAASLTPEEMDRSGKQALQSRDYAQALTWYRKAAEQNFAPGESGLAFMYQHGLGVPKDLVQAQQWYRKAAEQGLPTAQNEVGQGYLLGEGLPMDYKQAAGWFRKSADQGNPFGENQLGFMYLKGWGGFPRDFVQALQWFRKSANQNLALGQYNLGNMYLNGWGLPQDYAQAAQWFRKAADQGNGRAQQAMGTMYQNGWGVAKDEAQAQSWFDKAKAATRDQP